MANEAAQGVFRHVATNTSMSIKRLRELFKRLVDNLEANTKFYFSRIPEATTKWMKQAHAGIIARKTNYNSACHNPVGLVDGFREAINDYKGYSNSVGKIHALSDAILQAQQHYELLINDIAKSTE